MKILLVHTHLPDAEHSEEAHGYLRRLARHLKDAGCQPSLLTATGPNTAAIHSKGICQIPGLAFPVRRPVFPSNRAALQTALHTATRFVKTEHPDVIHVHNVIHPGLLAQLQQLCPVLHSVHDCRPFCMKPPPDDASRLRGDSDQICSQPFGAACWQTCYRHAGNNLRSRVSAWRLFPAVRRAVAEIRQCHTVICGSRHLYDLALSSGVPPQRLHKVLPFCELEDQVPAQTQMFHSMEQPQLVFSGTLMPASGIRHLLAALRRLPRTLSYRASIIGDGPLRRETEQLIHRTSLSDNVRLHGALPPAQRAQIYRDSDLMIFPALGSTGCGMTGIEAMYCGTPVIGFKTGGVEEWLIDGQTGLVLERGDIAGLAAAIHALILDEPRRRELGKAAQAHVRTLFRKDQHLQAMLDLYRHARLINRIQDHEPVGADQPVWKLIDRRSDR